MLLFSRKKDHGVQGFILKLVNAHCPGLTCLREGPRAEGRGHLTVVVLVVPMEKGEPRVEKTFAALTREFAASGLSLVLNEPRGLDELLVGFAWEGGIKFLRGQAKHLNPMGGGFYQLGVRLAEVIHPSDYPELAKLHF